MTATHTIEEVAKGMFSFHIQSKWARLEDLLRVAIGIPLPNEAKNRKESSIPASYVEGLKVLLHLFRVDETGAFRNPEKFNEAGFRESFYNEIQRKVFCSRRTVSNMVGAFRDAGLLDTYQEIEEDGSMGQWWTRLNPWALLEKLKELALRKGKKQAAVESTQTVEPCANICAPLSSSKQQAEVAVATQSADAVKKGDKPLAGVDPILPEGTSDFPAFAKAEILKSETGKVLPKLVAVIPEFEKANIKQLKKLHDLVHHFVPTLRCNLEMVETLSELVAHDPAALEGFSKIGNHDPDSKLGAVDTFLKFWRGIAKKLWQQRLSRHDQNVYADRFELAGIKQDWFMPISPAVSITQLTNDRKKDPASFWIRSLSLALTHKWTAFAVGLIAKRARGYLMNRPVIYTMMCKKHPEIVRLCDIPEKWQKKLKSQATQTMTRINVWNEILDTYGFEFINIDLQQRGAGSVLPHSETNG